MPAINNGIFEYLTLMTKFPDLSNQVSYHYMKHTGSTPTFRKKYFNVTLSNTMDVSALSTNFAMDENDTCNHGDWICAASKCLEDIKDNRQKFD